jgi:hypothetical protein
MVQFQFKLDPETNLPLISLHPRIPKPNPRLAAAADQSQVLSTAGAGTGGAFLFYPVPLLSPPFILICHPNSESPTPPQVLSTAGSSGSTRLSTADGALPFAFLRAGDTFGEAALAPVDRAERTADSCGGGGGGGGGGRSCGDLWVRRRIDAAAAVEEVGLLFLIISQHSLSPPPSPSPFLSHVNAFIYARTYILSRIHIYI